MTFSIEAQFDTPSNNLWELLTDGKYTKQYMFGCEPDTAWKKGGELLWKDSSGKVLVKGSIVDIQQKRKLHYTTFDPNSALKDTPENYMLVTCDIADLGGACLLKVTQGDFLGVENASERYQACQNGWKYVFDKIKVIVNNSKK